MTGLLSRFLVSGQSEQSNLPIDMPLPLVLTLFPRRRIRCIKAAVPDTTTKQTPKAANQNVASLSLWVRKPANVNRAACECDPGPAYA